MKQTAAFADRIIAKGFFHCIPSPGPTVYQASLWIFSVIYWFHSACCSLVPAAL